MGSFTREEMSTRRSYCGALVGRGLEVKGTTVAGVWGANPIPDLALGAPA